MNTDHRVSMRNDSCCQRAFILAVAVALLVGGTAQASVTVPISQDASPSPTFSFPDINVQLSGADRGNTPNATVSVIEGSLASPSGSVTKLNDVLGQTTRLGYTLLGSVNTTNTYGLNGGQYVVRFQGNNAGLIGNFRYLLWLIKPPQYYYGYWNYTFYGEFDVVGTNSTALVPTPITLRAMGNGQLQLNWPSGMLHQTATNIAVY